MISVLLPTRKRSNELRRMVESLRATARNQVEVVIYVDDDDQDSVDIARELCIKYIVGPRIVLTQCWNECLRLATGDIFMQGNDDIVFKTKGWDEQVEGAFAKSKDKILLVHGSDGGNFNGNFGPHPFVHRRWVDTVGYFIPPYFSSDYGDTWNNDVANILNRRKYIPFVIEHLHIIYGKAQCDENTLERLARHRRDEVDQLYRELQNAREEDANKLKNVMNIPYVSNMPKWTIMILTQPSRHQYLKRILSILDPQVKKVKGVEVVIRVFDPSMTLGSNRQVMREEAKGEYSCFVDDDDVISDDYVDKILPLLDGVDQVGFRLQCYMDGKAIEPTYHSIKYNNWFSDENGHYRDISHINPIKTVLALRATMEGGYGEDSRWSESLRALSVVNTEHYIQDIMYHYYCRTVKSDDDFVFNPSGNSVIERKKAIAKRISDSGIISYEQRGYNIKPCPKCGEVQSISPIANGLRCNQCGHQYL